MREITSHKINELNEALQITTLDEPGPGGANHVYGVAAIGGQPGDGDNARPSVQTMIRFQNGPIKEVGVNGVSNEALLAIVEDRLARFQEGPYKCRENALALTKIQEAMHWLHHRTRGRLARGVEGTSEK